MPPLYITHSPLIHIPPLSPYQVDAAFWPIVQVFNFYYLPTSLRLIYVNSMCLVWAVILSYFKHNVSDLVKGLVQINFDQVIINVHVNIHEHVSCAIHACACALTCTTIIVSRKYKD